jgi:protein-tyrosine phosphatase
MFRRILFVCTGNICRSPMAEGLMKSLVSTQEASWTISSAGIAAVVNNPATSNAQIVLKKYDLNISQHLARQITEKIVIDSDLILTMEEMHQREILHRYPFAYGRVFLLGKWQDFEVPDPYGKPLKHYENTYELIKLGLEDWLNKICKSG